MNAVAKIKQNFETFCLHLLENGVPLSTVNAIRAEVDSFTSRGLDPKFEIVETGIVIQGKLFPLHINPQPAERGLGIVVTTAIAVGSMLMKMLPEDFVGNTFGAVFANGFDLSCWNASYNESKATEALKVDIPYLVNDYSGLAKNPNTTTLNKFLNGIAGYISDSIHGQQSKYASCTRKGYALRQKGAEEARDQVLSMLKSGGLTLTPTGSRPGHIRTTAMPSYPEGTVYEWGQTAEYAYTYDSYSVSGGSTVIEPEKPKEDPTTADSSKGSTINNDNSSDNTNTTVTETPKPIKKANTGLIVGGIALATLPFLFMANKPGISPIKPATKTKK